MPRIHKQSNFITQDLYRYGGLYGTKGYLKGLKYPGFKYTFLLRLYNNTQSFLVRFVIKLLSRHYSIKYGFQIPLSTKIGPGLHIGHFGSIVINGASIIGDNCNISHNVTIGQQNRGGKKGCPIIGNYVWIGTGAVIVGKIKIGNRVLIAPNSYVNIDIPDNSVVIGNPAKVFPKEDAIESYINFTTVSFKN